MRRESKQERELWTAAVEDRQPVKPNKYGAVRAGRFASGHEADVASNLVALESRGLIQDLQFQVPVVLVPGLGKVHGVVYVADFAFVEDKRQRYLDAKGFRTPVYRLKKRLARLLHNIEIEEV